jgi:hypothetical protein
MGVVGIRPLDVGLVSLILDVIEEMVNLHPHEGGGQPDTLVCCQMD